MMRTANPALNNNTFGNESIVSTQKMTLDGTVNKCFILLFCVMATA